MSISPKTKGVVQISKDENVIIVSMDSSVFHIVKHVDAVLKEQHWKFAINKMKPVSVRRMYKVKCAIDV